MSKRVLLAMSGGVDSSVAAYLLCEQGYEVIGLFMRTGAHTPAAAATARSLPILDSAPARPKRNKQGCCSAADSSDARRVADQLDIPFYAVDFEHEFGRIMDYFVAEYTQGRTPNPCVMCNNWLKFGRLWEYAQQMRADYIATGHYARIVGERGAGNAERGTDGPRERGAGNAERGTEAQREDGLHPAERAGQGLRNDGGTASSSAFRVPRSEFVGAASSSAFRVPRSEFALLRARDPAKDQSYVLFGLRREILPHLLFPVGEYSKPQIRQLARELELRVADKPDSQEICFLPTQDHHAFIRDRLPDFDGSGDIVDMAGNRLGQHHGFEAYTIGQRKGLGVALGKRRYVVRIDAAERRVVLGSREDLLGRMLEADQVNWLCEPPTSALRCEAKIRYLHPAAPATVTPWDSARVHVTFDDPQCAITPGQAVVFYQSDRVLGGGYIRGT